MARPGGQADLPRSVDHFNLVANDNGNLSRPRVFRSMSVPVHASSGANIKVSPGGGRSVRLLLPGDPRSSWKRSSSDPPSNRSLPPNERVPRLFQPRRVRSQDAFHKPTTSIDDCNTQSNTLLNLASEFLSGSGPQPEPAQPRLVRSVSAGNGVPVLRRATKRNSDRHTFEITSASTGDFHQDLNASNFRPINEAPPLQLLLRRSQSAQPHNNRYTSTTARTTRFDGPKLRRSIGAGRRALRTFAELLLHRHRAGAHAPSPEPDYDHDLASHAQAQGGANTTNNDSDGDAYPPADVLPEAPRFFRQTSNDAITSAITAANGTPEEEMLERRRECMETDLTYLSSVFAGFFSCSKTWPRIYTVLLLSNPEDVRHSPGVRLMFRFRKWYPSTLLGVTAEEGRSLEANVSAYRSFLQPEDVGTLQTRVDNLILKGSDGFSPAERTEGFVWEVCDLVSSWLEDFVGDQLKSAPTATASTPPRKTAEATDLRSAVTDQRELLGSGLRSIEILSRFDTHCELDAVLERTAKAGAFSTNMEALKALMQNGWSVRKAVSAAPKPDLKNSDTTTTATAGTNMEWDMDHEEVLKQFADEGCNWDEEQECDACGEDLCARDGITNEVCGHWICLPDFELYVHVSVQNQPTSIRECHTTRLCSVHSFAHALCDVMLARLLGTQTTRSWQVPAHSRFCGVLASDAKHRWTSLRSCGLSDPAHCCFTSKVWSTLK